MQNFWDKERTWLGELKECWFAIALIIAIVIVSLVLSCEPEFQRECVLFSEGVWSNTCIHTPR